MSGWQERRPSVTLGFTEAPSLRSHRRRRFPGLELAAAFVAGFAVAMILVALIR